MKILYVPGHLRAALEAAGAKGASVYEIENLVNILSPEDVAFYCYVNMSLAKVLPASIAQSFPSALVASRDPFASNSNDKRVKEALRILNEYCLNDSAPVPHYEGLYLTCDLMDEDTIQFTHVAIADGIDTPSPAIGERTLIDRVIQQLHGFLPFEAIAKLPLFAGYLSASQAILGNPAQA